VGTALDLLADGAAPASAVYRFHPASGTADSVSILLDAPPTTAAYIGLADFGRGRWVFSGPYSGPKTLPLDDPAYISPSGNLWLAVLAPVGQSARVEQLSIRAQHGPNLPPTAQLAADLSAGNAPLLVHFDATGSSDSDGELVEYAWDWDGDGIFDGFTA